MEERPAATAAEQKHGMLNGQRRLPYAGERFLLGSYGANGCTLIAVYNALQLLGKPRPLGEICRDFRKKHRFLLFGKWGAGPWSIGAYLREHGVPCSGSRTLDEMTEELTEGSILVFCVMNERHPFRGFHTMTAQYRQGMYAVYNVSGMDRECRVCRTLADSFPRGRFVYGYRIGLRSQNV